MIGLVLSVLSIYWIYMGYWFGLLILPVGLILPFAHAGIQIDFRDRTYREFIGLMRFRYGKWNKLPPVQYVTIFIERYAQRGSLVTIDNVSRFSKIKVSLIISKEERWVGGLFDNYEKALQAGTIIAK
ncbi:MAG: hypothetical protein P8100_07700, partial [bacterium]